MQKKKTLVLGAAALMTVTLFACVTINIYFPAEKVETAAGEIVKDIRGQESGTGEAGKEENQSSIHRGIWPHIRLALSPAAAWAQEATTVSNPTIRALKKKMKVRFQTLKPYYRKGAVKEGDDGYLSIADTSGLSLKEKRDLKVLTEAENNDRQTLYQEVAKALNIDPGQIDRVAKIFATEWQKPVR